MNSTNYAALYYVVPPALFLFLYIL